MDNEAPLSKAPKGAKRLNPEACYLAADGGFELYMWNNNHWQFVHAYDDFEAMMREANDYYYDDDYEPVDGGKDEKTQRWN